MKLNKGNALVYALLLIAIGMSSASLAISIPSGRELDFDYQGVIVGIFSLLVTLLIGWNIFSVINVKDAKEQMERSLQETQSNVDKSIKRATDEYAESKKILDSLEAKLNKISYDGLQNTIDLLSGAGLISDDGKEVSILRVYSRLLVIHHGLNNSSDYIDTLGGIYDYYISNKDNLSLSKDEANSILAILFPIAKSEVNDSKFSEIYNWLSSFLMK